MFLGEGVPAHSKTHGEDPVHRHEKGSPKRSVATAGVRISRHRERRPDGMRAGRLRCSGHFPYPEPLRASGARDPHTRTCVRCRPAGVEERR